MRSFFTRCRNYLITGIVVVFPLFAAIAILWFVFIKMTNFVLKFLPHENILQPEWNVAVRILVPVIIIIILAFIGRITKIVFIGKIFGLGERVLVKIPLFNKIYIALKQISAAFLSRNQTFFKQVVLVEYPRKGLYSIGFVSSKKKDPFNKTIKGKIISVFMPTTPNPTSGVLIYVPEDHVKLLDLSIEEGLKLVISGGTVYPYRYDMVT